jgi:hypothetical protein
MNFFLSALSEPSGNPSSMRLLTAVVVIAIMAGWLSVTIHDHVMAPLPWDGSGGILVAALGVKGWQRGRESTDKSNEKTTP